MIIYRFRLTSEEQEDFIREIEIQPTQTFLDFHDIILSCSDLEGCQNAFFYTTDKKYKKHDEISYKQKKKQVRKYDEDLDKVVTEELPLHLMKNSKLSSFIDDPHQKMIYEYFGKEFHAFNLELFKIYKTEDNYFLPRCTKSTGELPKKIDITQEPVMAPPEGDDIHPSLLAASKDMMFTGMQEDEAEIAEIESHLDEILLGVAEEAETVVVPVPELDENDLMDQEDEIQLESINDYDDIEKLEMNHRKFDADSDD